VANLDHVDTEQDGQLPTAHVQKADRWLHGMILGLTNGAVFSATRLWEAPLSI
jgi:hypothetical protein